MATPALTQRRIQFLRMKALRGTLALITRYTALLLRLTTPDEEQVRAAATQSMAGHLTYYQLDPVSDAYLSLIFPIMESAIASGQTRAVALDGTLLPPPDFVDHASIAEMARHQLEYIDHLTTAQRETFTATLTQAQREGWSLEDTADRAVEAVKDITRQRAELIAKTEIIKAHGQGMRRTLEYHGVDEYLWSTRPLSAPTPACDACRALDGSTFKTSGPLYPSPIREDDPGYEDRIKEAEDGGFSVLPVVSTHPRCTCVIVAK
jgi:hypothetical protein